jgi:hypothetical protein
MRTSIDRCNMQPSRPLRISVGTRVQWVQNGKSSSGLVVAFVPAGVQPLTLCVPGIGWYAIRKFDTYFVSQDTTPRGMTMRQPLRRRFSADFLHQQNPGEVFVGPLVF